MVVTAMKATLVRAGAALCLGVAAAFLGKTGVLLLVTSALAYLLAVLVQRSAWRGTVLKFDGAGLMAAAKQGLPLTISLTLLAISSVADRFIIANLVSTADAGKYIAGLDLVRQALMMPAISIAAAFVPLAVQINANQGTAAVRSHLGECIELLLCVTLPACLGFAVISSHVANVVLGVDFRAIAAETMPIVAGRRDVPDPDAAIPACQLLAVGTQLLLSDQHGVDHRGQRDSVIRLISAYGTIGAAWARLGADLFGFVCALILSRRAFPIPFPLRRIAADRHRRIDHGAAGRGSSTEACSVSDLTACLVLVGAGIASYVALCWLFDISQPRGRLKRALALFRTKFAKHQRLDRQPVNKTVTIDLRQRRCRRCLARRPASASAHPQSLLDLPPGEARESLLAVHGILGTQPAADQACDLRGRRRLDQLPAARGAAPRPRHRGRYRRGPDPQQRLRAGNHPRRRPEPSLRARAASIS